AAGRSSHSRSRSPEASSQGMPDSWTLRPGAWPTMRTRAERAACSTGRGPMGRLAAQWRQARTSSSRRSSGSGMAPGGSVSEQVRLLGRISDVRTISARERRELVVTIAGPGQDLDHRDLPHVQRVGHQRAMTAPWNGLGAHDRGAGVAADLHQVVDRVVERVGLHVVGVAAKALVAPAGVGRILARMPQAAQFGHRNVIDADGCKAAAQYVGVELGIVARARHGAYVAQLADGV